MPPFCTAFYTVIINIAVTTASKKLYTILTIEIILGKC